LHRLPAQHRPGRVDVGARQEVAELHRPGRREVRRRHQPGEEHRGRHLLRGDVLRDEQQAADRARQERRRRVHRAVAGERVQGRRRGEGRRHRQRRRPGDRLHDRGGGRLPDRPGHLRDRGRDGPPGRAGRVREVLPHLHLERGRTEDPHRARLRADPAERADEGPGVREGTVLTADGVHRSPAAGGPETREPGGGAGAGSTDVIEGGAPMTSETGVEARAGTRDGAAGAPMSTGRAGDRIFAGAARGSALTVLAIVAAIGTFLVWKAIPALQANEASFLTGQEWNPNAQPPRFGIAQLAFGPAMSSLPALLMATPVAIGIALFISFYSPRRLASGLGYVVDLLAAVPSIVYGLWGLIFLSQHMDEVSRFLNAAFGWFPLFGGDSPGKNSLFTASV